MKKFILPICLIMGLSACDNCRNPEHEFKMKCTDNRTYDVKMYKDTAEVIYNFDVEEKDGSISKITDIYTLGVPYKQYKNGDKDDVSIIYSAFNSANAVDSLQVLIYKGEVNHLLLGSSRFDRIGGNCEVISE